MLNSACTAWLCRRRGAQSRAQYEKTGRPARTLPAAAPRQSAGGFSVIELAIVITLIGIITAMGLPALSDLVRDNGVRARAESFCDGLRLARIEAIHRNARVDFVPDGVGWSVTTPDREGGPDLVLRELAAGPGDANYTASASHGQLAFDGTGRASVSDFSASFGYAGLRCQADGGDIRCLQVRTSPNGTVRMCDLATSSPNPSACE